MIMLLLVSLSYLAYLSNADPACCDCTESSYSPNCNEGCDNTICPYDSYCCNYSWDWICANSAVYECDASGGNQEPEAPPSDPNAIDCCDCTNSKNTPNCNEGCDETICPYDSYCCNYSWDWICANSAVQECDAAQETPSDESCCDCTESQNTPNCNEQCDNTICPYDAYCCNYSWDWICANSAVYECDAAGGNEEPEEPPTTADGTECCDCTNSKNTPNCNEGCDETICPYDSYCCNNSWDWICANSAVQECAAANEEEETPSDASCCDCTDPKNSPNCNEQCDNTICPYDSYCCNYSWDWICANSAVQECDASQNEEGEDFYPAPEGSAACCECTETSDSANCNEGCDSTICPYDSYCCNNKWDWICADSAKSECEAAGVPIYEGEETIPEEGIDEACCECTETESTSGCTPNPTCDAIVCPIDSYCCNYSWDGICANGANNICNSAEYWSWPTEEETGSCCDCTEESDNSGCNEVCENEVCPLDSYCCNNKWDWICANGAENICQGDDYFNSDSYGYSDYGYSSYEYTPSYDSYDSFNYGSSDYYYEPYYYGGYDSYYSDSYGEEEIDEDIPDCFMNACGYQINQCVSSADCYQGVEAVEGYCESNFETPEECVETLIQDANSQQVITICNGNETAAGYLQEVGQCFLNTINSGECPEDQDKTLKVKSLVKASRKVKARDAKAARRQQQRKTGSSKRLRSRLSKSQRQRGQRRRQRRVRSQRSRKVRPRGARRSLMAQSGRSSPLSRRARSSRPQKRPQRSRRVRSRKALAQKKRKRQRRSQRAQRQKKRLRKN